MKKITFLLSLIITSSIYAQSLQMPDIPAEGVVYETLTLNSTFGIPPSDSWDFSDFEPVDQVDVTMIPIENSQYNAAAYPNTTHVKSFLSGSQQVVQFPGFTSTGYTYNGESSIIFNNYYAPLTIMPYPFSVGDTWTDAVYDIAFTCPICPPSMFRDHEVETQALDSGTVTMPDGTVYENVILVQHTATFSDAQTGSSPCVTTRTSHFWWAEDLGIPLIETYFQTTSGACSFDDVSFTRFYSNSTEYVSDCPDEYELPIVWRDGFECHTPFAIDNIEGWTAIDGEGGTTWGANDVDFTNESYVGAGIIWNSNEADNLGNDISGYNAYEGNQGLYFFASGANSTPFPNDDWMISPEFTISGVSSPTLTFWAKSITDAYGLDRFQIAIGSSTNPADFTVISAGAYEEAPLEWTQYEYDLSAYDGQTVRVGIHCVSNDSFVLQMDSFVVEGTLGVNDVQSLEMNIYPNPVNGNFVTIQTPSNGTKYVEVFDITGKRLINTSLSADTLEVSSLSAGVYLIKVTVEGQSKTSKLIVR
jgi:hypothetical protein